MGNFILTKSNLVNACEHEDSEVLYPLTKSEQVIVGDNTSLAAWIEGLDIPSETTIPFHYNTGIKTATINNVDLYTPYLRTIDSVKFDGIAKFDWNYFKLGTQEHNDEVQFDLLFVSDYENNTLNVGSIKNIGNDTLTNITIPKTFLNISYDDINERIQFDLNTGSFEDHAYISKDLMASMSASKTYTLSNGDDNTIVLSDGDTETTATYQTYTASHGLTLEDEDIQHTNNITAGTLVASVTEDHKLNIPSISYDSNGHISSVNDNKIDISNINFKIIEDINHSDFLDGYAPQVRTTLGNVANNRNKQLYLYSSNQNAVLDIIVKMDLEFLDNFSRTLYLKLKGSHRTTYDSWEISEVSLFSFDYTLEELEAKITKTSITDQFVIFGGNNPEIRIGDFEASDGINNFVKKDIEDARPWWYEENINTLTVTILGSSLNETLFSTIDFRWKDVGTVVSSQYTDTSVATSISLDELQNGEELRYYIAPQTSTGFLYNVGEQCFVIDCDQYITCANNKISWTSNALSNHYTIEQSRHDINSAKTYFLKIKKCTKL